MPITHGTTALDICPTCGNHTMDKDGYCHYAYCGDDDNECTNCTDIDDTTTSINGVPTCCIDCDYY